MLIELSIDVEKECGIWYINIYKIEIASLSKIQTKTFLPIESRFLCGLRDWHE